MEQLNETWNEFCQQERLKWVTALPTTLTEFFTTLTFVDLDMEKLKDGYVDNSYTYTVYQLEVEAMQDGKKIEVTISNASENVTGGDKPWVVNGSFDLEESMEGYGRMCGNQLSSLLHLSTDPYEKTIQKIFTEFKLAKKIEEIAEAYFQREDEEEAMTIKEKWGDVVSSVRKHDDFWHIELKNGMIIKGDLWIEQRKEEAK